MSILYTYGTGSNYESKRYDDIKGLLDQLVDNTANLILAKNVRNSVYSLWEKVSSLELTVASFSSASGYFQNDKPTTQKVGGIEQGTTFSIPQTIQDMFEKLLYPYAPPTLSLSSIPNKEYGDALNFQLSWSITKNSEPITTIKVVDEQFQPNGAVTQSGNKLVSGTWSYPLPAYTKNTFTMSVSDGKTITKIDTSFEWMNKIYWGTLDLTSLENPDLAKPDALTRVASTYFPTDKAGSDLIKGLTGAGISPGNALAKVKDKTYTDINAAGKYLIFAWPSSVPNATTPKFLYGPLPFTAMSNLKGRIATAGTFNFENRYGISTNYEVWISNTTQNAKLTLAVS